MAFDAKGDLTYVGTKKKSIEVESLNKAFLDHECRGD